MQKTALSFLLMMALPFAACSQEPSEEESTALRNISRSIDILDATWNTSIKGSADNLYLVDTYNTVTGAVSGPSDVWPYTAVIEAHCSILEALNAAKDIDKDLYEQKFPIYKSRLEQLIDNLEYYRGTYTLSSYATSNKEWSPFAVPRASRRGAANVTGILNVYDDQMWLSRELIRAYRLTGNDAYLTEAAYLADYALEGWDCWRDADGNEYGGITWGPGYNSKHACSNAPLIQPLVWLHDIYSNSGETIEYFYRDENNNVASATVERAEYYLNFAKKIYDWQKTRLKHSSGVYWDMMGADNTILVSRGYRQHVDCGNPTGSLISYNTGTMIAGAAELYRTTSQASYLNDMGEATRASLNQFAKYVRSQATYEFSTDETARNGFTTWFNDVLMRACVDAEPYVENTAPKNILNSFQTCLDYAFENHNRNNLLPIHLLEGWGTEEVTKGFHQMAFASQYAMLAVRLLAKKEAGVTANRVTACATADNVYTISGVSMGAYDNVKQKLPKGMYIVGAKKLLLGNN